MQNEILEKGPLLTEEGSLTNPGWARDLILDYKRSAIRANKFRIKEWDYYCIINHETKKAIALTIADNSYMGLLSATYLDLNKPMQVTKTKIKALTNGNYNMPETSKSGNISVTQDGLYISFEKDNTSRILKVDCPYFHKGFNLKGEITLHQPDAMDTMVIATPFNKDKKAFYYNHKINCMDASGELYFGDEKVLFERKNSFGVLDWGRGVWTYSNTWYWGSASGSISNIPFGFNIGYGFGDNNKATENVVFYDNKAHKLADVKFHIPEDDYLKPWKFTSSDNRFEMDFQPIIDRNSNTNILVLKSLQHQIFGLFTGRVVLDNGEEIQVKNFLGFAEKVVNKW
ncbi:DUF2804 domain-containing protein [Clostridium swellfunianum]|uniref:DUF2804 domain-containing protein n=1 Tax=Clostridium swellfunianum TaxID=1367462 RepID=UPI00202F0D08|nr:DUF2804 domain-containing protein [Clostridium swellfunianum]MCM0648099.1 DUF2804 domain-containing protein [Clostridium swellfunianum]